MYNKAASTILAIACLVTSTCLFGQRTAGSSAQFDMVGIIQDAKADAPLTTLDGGSITINGHKIVVPKNAIVQMPAATLSWGELFQKAPAAVKINTGSGTNAGQPQTGMALSDTPKLPGTYEARVVGNIVPDGRYIAGLIFLSQQSLNNSAGFIDAIDYANATLTVNGTRVQLNDPTLADINTGRFSAGQSPDVRFSVDQDNPTVRSETGYPMCIPRTAPPASDPLCPQKNRPLAAGGGFQRTFQMDAPGTSVLGTDVTQQMPFEVGDYVTYAGTLANDNLGQFVSAHTVIANVGAYTAPFTDPAYVAIDVLLQGTGGIPNPNIAQEATAKVKVEGFSTDASRPVDITAIDVDCNGNAHDRQPFWILAQAVDPGPPTGAKKGRFRFVPPGGDFLPPTSLVHVRVSGANGQNQKLANGLIWGQYVAPDFEFIFPETLVVGGPITPNNFGDFPWLVNGIGPWGSDGSMVGQLDPWPDVSAPATTCTQNPPGTKLNANFTATPNPVIAGNTVTLDASAALASGATSFAWTPAIKCSNTACSAGTFTTPTTAPAGNTMNFTLNVTGAGGTTASSTVPVTVNPNNVPRDTVTITAATYSLSKARLTVNATSSIVQSSPTNCSLTAPQPGCLILTTDQINPTTGKPWTAIMQNTGGGLYTVILTGSPLPNSVTVVSGNGGTATSGITRLR